MSAAFVLTVEFEVQAEHIEAFKVAISENAAASVRDEEGCLQFDVAQDASSPDRFLLYEVYSSRAAFDDHMKQRHTSRFLELAKSMVQSQSHRIFDRVAAPAKAETR